MARLWSVDTGEVKKEYSGHQKAVVCLAFRDESIQKEGLEITAPIYSYTSYYLTFLTSFIVDISDDFKLIFFNQKKGDVIVFTLNVQRLET
ncbi:LST8-like protein [Mya arenaria]|uniref:LST8-like protein n=1 Tax=Mya arenaria TaxID=6604 RepID=A0ABY7DIH9_MYAAR|nr:LST8-like protein [Mya arenaria]